MVTENERSNILSIQAIRDVEDITEEVKEVPVWKGSVVIRSITKRQFDKIKDDASDSGKLDQTKLERLLFLQGVVEPKFLPDDYEWLLDKSATAMTDITNSVINISGLGENVVKQEEKSFRPE